MRVSVCVYMWVSVCIAGLALCSVAQFWLNKENTVGPMKCQGLGGTNIDKWEDESEGERDREAWVVKAPQLKLHVPLWIPCVITCVSVCACMYACAQICVFSSVVSLPVVPLPQESMFTQRDLWAVTTGLMHPSSPQWPRDAVSLSVCHLQTELIQHIRHLVSWQMSGNWTERLISKSKLSYWSEWRCFLLQDKKQKVGNSLQKLKAVLYCEYCSPLDALYSSSSTFSDSFKFTKFLFYTGIDWKCGNHATINSTHCTAGVISFLYQLLTMHGCYVANCTLHIMNLIVTLYQ